MAVYRVPAGGVSLWVQVSVPSTQVQPVPAMLVALRPAGRVSVTVTTPLVGAKPEFVAVIDWKSTTFHSRHIPLSDFVIRMSSSWVIGVASLAQSLAVV